MKNFADRTMFFVISLILILTSCKNECKQSEEIFLTKTDFFLEIISAIDSDNLRQEWNKKDLEKNVKLKTTKALNKLDFKNIKRFKDVYVFSFKTKHDTDFLDRIFNKNMKSCNVYLFYSINLKNREEVINYPQYSECRYERKELTQNWTYTFQMWYCAD